jgi:quercetin dioxygenase-like cupin family protein
MRRRARVVALLGILLAPGVAAAQEPQGRIEERVALENEAVRVAVITFEPGAASGRHIGLEAEMGIVMEGELTLVTDAGTEVLRPGTVRWLAARTPHDVRNEGDRPVRLWVVFFKKCE